MPGPLAGHILGHILLLYSVKPKLPNPHGTTHNETHPAISDDADTKYYGLNVVKPMHGKLLYAV